MKNLRKNLLMKTSYVLFIAMSFYACKEDPKEEPKPSGNEPAEVLDCNAFQSNITLIDYPNRPIDYIINCKGSSLALR